MTGNARGRDRILGSLRVAEGKGVVRIEDRYHTDIDDLWSAITEPTRLARWFGKVDGELRPGGRFRLHIEADGVESAGHIEVCEPPRRLRFTTRETDASYEKGRGAAPFDEITEVTLTVDGEQTMLVAEIRGVPIDKVEYYGVGWQIHAESLATHVAGQDRGDTEPRWNELLPSYRELASGIR